MKREKANKGTKHRRPRVRKAALVEQTGQTRGDISWIINEEYEGQLWRAGVCRVIGCEGFTGSVKRTIEMGSAALQIIVLTLE